MPPTRRTDCTNVPGSVSCACKPGHTSNGVQFADINECTVNKGAVPPARRTAPTFRAVSPARASQGTRAIKSRAPNIDEFLTNNGGCGASELCTNTPGRYTCLCPTGPGTCSPGPDTGSRGTDRGTAPDGGAPNEGETPGAGNGLDGGGSNRGGPPRPPDSGSSPNAGGTPNAGSAPRPAAPGPGGGQ
ncbi:hypothetical protein JY572_27390 [Myxococcus landrumensis]|uniref:NOTCH1 EGF-like calcium-binding domain-containing protein n=1 Tax=Myxococcus landrumensis TaxID=2813577 RepID=A0ABX7NJ85_9BACT|nr:hypothetical protein JY572_27390 [Myxococcus landrumus]